MAFGFYLGNMTRHGGNGGPWILLRRAGAQGGPRHWGRQLEHVRKQQILSARELSRMCRNMDRVAKHSPQYDIWYIWCQIIFLVHVFLSVSWFSFWFVCYLSKTWEALSWFLFLDFKVQSVIQPTSVIQSTPSLQATSLPKGNIILVSKPNSVIHTTGGGGGAIQTLQVVL